MAQKRKDSGFDPLDFPEAKALKNRGMNSNQFGGENEIFVENLLASFTRDADGEQYFKSASEIWMPFEFLVGQDPCVQ